MTSMCVWTRKRTTHGLYECDTLGSSSLKSLQALGLGRMSRMIFHCFLSSHTKWSEAFSCHVEKLTTYAQPCLSSSRIFRDFSLSRGKFDLKRERDDLQSLSIHPSTGPPLYTDVSTSLSLYPCYPPLYRPLFLRTPDGLARHYRDQ